MPDEKANEAVLLTALEKEQGLCPARSNCRSCANVDYVYFTGVVCLLMERRIDTDGICRSHLSDAE